MSTGTRSGAASGKRRSSSRAREVWRVAFGAPRRACSATARSSSSRASKVSTLTSGAGGWPAVSGGWPAVSATDSSPTDSSETAPSRAPDLERVLGGDGGDGASACAGSACGASGGGAGVGGGGELGSGGARGCVPAALSGEVSHEVGGAGVVATEAGRRGGVRGGGGCARRSGGEPGDLGAAACWPRMAGWNAIEYFRSRGSTRCTWWQWRSEDGFSTP